MHITNLEQILSSWRDTIAEQEMFQKRARDICVAGIAQAAYISERLSVPPIDPAQTFPVLSDTKVLTWSDYAVCRP
jgi:hypothetical protein